jgi:hypothetical protein
MGDLSTGDQSGRLDTSGVDLETARGYARRMFNAVMLVRITECRAMHEELNLDPELYQLALDLFKDLCKERGIRRIGKWGHYIK